jgi:excisionase family DNA binding protein
MVAVHEDDLHRLPVVVDLVTAAGVLGIGRTTAYEMVRTGRWPTPVLRLGNRIRVPTAALRELLSLSTDSPDPRTRIAAER